jgi:hypothetical protein
MVMVDEGIWRRCEDLYEIDSCAGSPSYIYTQEGSSMPPNRP